jgi:hypothetical protein
MNTQLRDLLHTYARRRSPWGPPWWIYGVAFGAANLLRQAVIIVSPAEIPQPIRVASWIATALLVIVVINGVAVALRGRGNHPGPGHAHTLTPLWPLRRAHGQVAHSPTASSKEAPVTKQQPQEQPSPSTRWAPWWAYLVIIVGANYLRRAVLPDGSTPALRVAVALTVSAVLFVVITVIYRALVRAENTCTT